MLYSTFGDKNSFTQFKSTNMTDEYVFGSIEGQEFRNRILYPSHRILTSILTQEQIRIYNLTDDFKEHLSLAK